MRAEQRQSKAFDRRRVRWLVRALILVTAILLLVPWTRHWGLARLVPAFSPLVAIASVIGTRSITWTTCLGLGVAAIVLVRHRWFCRWICPTGLLADEAARLGRRCGRRSPRTRPIGQWVALVTLGGAWLGYPMLLWLDPLALLSAPFGILGEVTGIAVWLCVGGLAMLLLISAIWPGIWCARLCPLGATQDLLGRISRFATRTTPSPAECTNRPAPADVQPGMSRRAAIGTVIGVGWAAAARPLHGRAPNCIRPPGALRETEFVGMCVRCGNCIRACPTNIIQPDLLRHGLAGLLAPVVEFDTDYCLEDCTQCVDVCPSGALQPLTVEDKIATPMGVVRVDMDLCLLLDNRECWACRNHCPYDAVTFVWSEAEYTLTPKVDPAKCPGCGACEVACPTTSKKAIVVRPLSD